MTGRFALARVTMTEFETLYYVATHAHPGSNQAEFERLSTCALTRSLVRTKTMSNWSSIWGTNRQLNVLQNYGLASTPQGHTEGRDEEVTPTTI